MTTFLVVILALEATAIISKLAQLARGEISNSTPTTHALDVALDTVLLVWAAVLLAGIR